MLATKFTLIREHLGDLSLKDLDTTCRALCLTTTRLWQLDIKDLSVP